MDILKIVLIDYFCNRLYCVVSNLFFFRKESPQDLERSAVRQILIGDRIKAVLWKALL